MWREPGYWDEDCFAFDFLLVFHQNHVRAIDQSNDVPIWVLFRPSDAVFVLDDCGFDFLQHFLPDHWIAHIHALSLQTSLDPVRVAGLSKSSGMNGEDRLNA